VKATKRFATRIPGATVAVSSVLVLVTGIKATPIIFTEQGVGSGSLGGQAFSNQTFTITASGDTSARQAVSSGSGFFINDTSASIMLGTLGTFTFSTPTTFFVNNGTDNRNPSIGFRRAGTLGLDLTEFGPEAAFKTWDMTTSIGPISDARGFLLQWGSNFGTVIVNGGTALQFNDATAVPTVFKATVLPEPSTLALLGIGALALLGVGRAKRRLLA
jgi:hypothetical protein